MFTVWNGFLIVVSVLVVAITIIDPATMLLVYAIRNKHPKTASVALRVFRADPNAIHEGTSILTIAILVFSSFETDLLFILSELLHAGADPTYQDAQGQTALHYACRFLVPSSAVEILLKRSPRVLHITTNEFETAFHYAIDHHHQWEFCLNIVTVLLKYGANPNKCSGLQQTPPLVQACRNRVVPVVKLLLKQNIDVNATDINKRGSLIATLHSVLPGDIETIVKALLDCNADTTMIDNENMTAIMYAARRKKTMFLIGPIMLSVSLERALNGYCDDNNNNATPKLESNVSTSRFPCCPDFSWICMDTEDRFVKLVETIIESSEIVTKAAKKFVSSSKHVRIKQFESAPNFVTKVLSELVDRSGRRIIDAATPKIKDCLHKRLLFLGRFELNDGLPTHSSGTSTVILALDRQPHILYQDVYKAFCSDNTMMMDRISFLIAASVVGLNRVVSKSKFEFIQANVFPTSESIISLNDFVSLCAEYMDRGGKVRRVALKFLRDPKSFERETSALSFAHKGGILDARNFRKLSRMELSRRVSTLRNVLPILHAISEKESNSSYERNIDELERNFRWRLGDDNLVIGKNLIVLDAASRNLDVVQLMEDLSIDTIRYLLVSVLKTLIRIHRANICHGDVKPGNIVRVHTSNRTCWRLIDFDSAYTIGDVVNVQEKKLSAAFAPPEFSQCLVINSSTKDLCSSSSNNKKTTTITSKFDTWSFGVVSFELFAGRPLFRSDGTNDALADPKELFRICSWNGMTPSLLNQIASNLSNRDAEDVILSAQHFVASCLSCDPRNRPSSRDLLSHPFFRTLPSLYRNISKDIHDDNDDDIEQDTKNRYGNLSESDLIVKRKPHLFISYAQNDASGMATTLYFAFRRCGLSVWLDNFETDVTSDGMKEGISSSAFVLVCLTSNYLTRPWCLKELKWAIEMKKKIVFLREVDRRFSPWHYTCWRAGMMYDRDSSKYQKYEKKHEKYVYANFKPRHVRDFIDASSCNCAKNSSSTTLLSSTSCCTHSHVAFNNNNKNVPIGMMPFRRKQWAFDAMIDEILQRVDIRVPSISCLYQETTISSLPSMTNKSSIYHEKIVTPDTPKMLYIVSTADSLGKIISDTLSKSIARISNSTIHVTCLHDNCPFPDSLCEGKDEHVVIVLSKGILNTEVFSHVLRLSTRNLSFVYATRNDEIAYEETTQEWNFNGEEIKKACTDIQILLQSFEALPFRWLNEDRGLQYEHYAMVRELLRRIAVVSTRSRFSFG